MADISRRKNRNWKIMLPLAVLAWMILLNEALEVNIENSRTEAASADGLAGEALQTAEEGLTETEEPSTDVSASSVPTKTAAQADTEVTDTEVTNAEAANAKVTDAVTPTTSAVVYEVPQIRVLIMDTAYSTYYHSSVTVSLDGEKRTYTAENVKAEGGLVVLDGGEEGIAVLSVTRQEGNPVYPGSLEIRAAGEGLLLINELDLETYLEAVVPSEMPASYAQEALRAQAICARTYACRQMEKGSLRETYGADVDDSVSDQVYRNLGPKEETSLAVQATKGQVLTQNGELIEAYYFSTSAGVTSTDEIWGAEESAAYLKSVVCDFDSEEPWRKWNVTIPWGTLESRAAALDGCFGALLSLNAAKKSGSGAVTALDVVTEGGTVRVSGEYEIRQFLSPQGLSITESNGEVTTGGSLLPSAYFTIEVNAGENVTIDGGGYGHGVGMSQTAANAMAAEGYTCQEILEYFFKDVEITNLSELS